MHFTTIKALIPLRNIEGKKKPKGCSFFRCLPMHLVAGNAKARRRSGWLWLWSDPQNGGTDVLSLGLTHTSLANNASLAHFLSRKEKKIEWCLLPICASFKQATRVL